MPSSRGGGGRSHADWLAFVKGDIFAGAATPPCGASDGGRREEAAAAEAVARITLEARVRYWNSFIVLNRKRRGVAAAPRAFARFAPLLE